MRRYLIIAVWAWALLGTPAVIAQESDGTATAKQLGQLSEMIAKLDQLEQSVDDLLLAQALRLLSDTHDEWTFAGGGGFGETKVGITNDVAKVAAQNDYAMGKLRGAIFRNPAVTEDQKARALDVFDATATFIQTAYAFEKTFEKAGAGPAAMTYRTEIIPVAEAIRDEITSLKAELNLSIKLGGT